MSRTVREPDPITTLRQRLRVAEQAASDIVVAMEAFRASLRQVAAAVDDLPVTDLHPRCPCLRRSRLSRITAHRHALLAAEDGR